jgi:hypothetical protein
MASSESAEKSVATMIRFIRLGSMLKS